MKINMESIIKKAEKRLKEPDMEKKIMQACDNIILGKKASSGKQKFAPEEAAQKFVDVLKTEILNSAGTNCAAGQLGPTAISALTNIGLDGGVQKIGKNRYQIGVSFKGNLSRDSLYLDGYDGIDNLAALLNNGYNAKASVYGYWMRPGGTLFTDNIRSLQNRAGANFVGRAVNSFMSSYAAQYAVVKITTDDVYDKRI